MGNTCTWSGAVGNAWDTAGNWDVAPVSGNGDDIIFPNSPTRFMTTGPASPFTVHSITAKEGYYSSAYPNAWSDLHPVLTTNLTTQHLTLKGSCQITLGGTVNETTECDSSGQACVLFNGTFNGVLTLTAGMLWIGFTQYAPSNGNPIINATAACSGGTAYICQGTFNASNVWTTGITWGPMTYNYGQDTVLFVNSPQHFIATPTYASMGGMEKLMAPIYLYGKISLMTSSGALANDTAFGWQFVRPDGGVPTWTTTVPFLSCQNVYGKRGPNR